MEKHVPPLIEEKFTIEDKSIFDNLTMRLIANQQDPHWFFVLYQRGEPRKKVRKDMRLTFFRLRNILFRARWKRSYKRMKARVSRDITRSHICVIAQIRKCTDLSWCLVWLQVKDVHFDIVKQFWRRWREAKLEVDEEEAQAEQELFAADNVQRDAVRQVLGIEESDEEEEEDEDDDLEETEGSGTTANITTTNESLIEPSMDVLVETTTTTTEIAGSSSLSNGK